MRYAPWLAAALVLAGCGVELVTTTAIQGELQAQQLKAVRGQVAGASNTAGRASLERAIQAYRAEKGGNPPSLDALVPDFLPSVPVRADGAAYGYDPSKGVLLDGPAAPAPAGIAAQDEQTMKAVHDAINRYGMATGYYPAKLDDLYPTYLAKPPRTAAGEEFLYNNQNGLVTHPRQNLTGAGTAPTPALRPVAGGGGPMGEVMTGVGVQQQLNSMSNAGASSAQSYSTRSIDNSTATHTDRQNQVMDQLGL